MDCFLPNGSFSCAAGRQVLSELEEEAAAAAAVNLLLVRLKSALSVRNLLTYTTHSLTISGQLSYPHTFLGLISRCWTVKAAEHYGRVELFMASLAVSGGVSANTLQTPEVADAVRECALLCERSRWLVPVPVPIPNCLSVNLSNQHMTDGLTS